MRTISGKWSWAGISQMFEGVSRGGTAGLRAERHELHSVPGAAEPDYAGRAVGSWRCSNDDGVLCGNSLTAQDVKALWKQKQNNLRRPAPRQKWAQRLKPLTLRNKRATKEYMRQWKKRPPSLKTRKA